MPHRSRVPTLLLAIGAIAHLMTGRVTAQVVETIVGGGPTTVARGDLVVLDSDLSVDAADRLILNSDSRIYAVDTSGMVTVVAGTGVEMPDSFGGLIPYLSGGVRVPAHLMPVDRRFTRLVATTRSGAYYVASFAPASHYITRFTTGSDGTAVHIAGASTLLGEQNGVPALDSQIDGVGGLVELANGDIAFASAASIRRIEAATGLIQLAASGFDGGRVVDLDAATGSDNTFYIATERRVFRATVSPPGWVAVAGTGAIGDSGDGGPATEATFRQIADLAVDSLGNVYVSDSGAHKVRRFTAGGLVSTVAGTGERGFSGDGNAATAARLDKPSAIVVDSRGIVSFVDQGNFRVRQIDTLGILRTFVGSGRTVIEGRTGRQSTLYEPSGLATTPAGAVIFADRENNRIRRWDPSRDVVETVMGTGSPFRYENGPSGAPLIPIVPLWPGGIRSVGADAQGRIYWAGEGYVLEGGTYTPIGPALLRLEPERRSYTIISEGFNGAVVTDSEGRTYGVRPPSPSVVRVDGPGATPVVVYTPPTFAFITSLALDQAAGILYLAGEGSNLIAVELATGRYATVGPGGVSALAVDQSGHLYYATGFDIYRRTRNGRTAKVSGMGSLNDHLYFTGDTNHVTAASFNRITGLATDASGRLLIADSRNHRIRRLGLNSVATPARPWGLAVSTAGSTVTLSWNAGTEGGAPESFVIEAGARPGTSDIAVLTIPSSDTRYQAVGVLDGAYFVRVRAVNSVGASEASNEVSVLVGAGPPESLESTINGNTVTLTWLPGATGTPAGGYVVEAGTAPHQADIVRIVVPGAAMVARDVPPGTYFVRVRGRSATGALGPPSNEVTVIVSAVELPGPPLSPTATVNGDVVVLRWTEPVFGGAPIGYLVELLQASGGPVVWQLRVDRPATISVSGVPSGRYRLRVRAVNMAGVGPPSEEFVVSVG